jgi:hypothetical protein
MDIGVSSILLHTEILSGNIETFYMQKAKARNQITSETSISSMKCEIISNIFPYLIVSAFYHHFKGNFSIAAIKIAMMSKYITCSMLHKSS